MWSVRNEMSEVTDDTNLFETTISFTHLIESGIIQCIQCLGDNRSSHIQLSVFNKCSIHSLPDITRNIKFPRARPVQPTAQNHLQTDVLADFELALFGINRQQSPPLNHTLVHLPSTNLIFPNNRIKLEPQSARISNTTPN